MTAQQELGKKGESIAKSYLEDKAYEVLHCNWTAGHKEIDLVAKKQGILVICEVKTLSYNTLKEPQLAVNKSKQKLLIQAANTYLAQYQLDLEVRFDIIAIVHNNAGTQVTHLESAFRPY